MTHKLTYYPSPSQPGLSIQELTKEVREYIQLNGLENSWDGCTNQNHCCKIFYYDPEHQNNQTRELFNQVFNDKGPPQPGEICQNCARLTHNQINHEACGIYFDRPQICREYLCPPAKTRALIYNNIRTNNHD